MVLIVGLLVVTNLVTLMVLMLGKRHYRDRHVHQWSEWSTWLLSQMASTASFVRSRFCTTCRKAEQQTVGVHACWKCPHLDDFLASFNTDYRISRLERELWPKEGP